MLLIFGTLRVDENPAQVISATVRPSEVLTLNAISAASDTLERRIKARSQNAMQGFSTNRRETTNQLRSADSYKTLVDENRISILVTARVRLHETRGYSAPAEGPPKSSKNSRNRPRLVLFLVLMATIAASFRCPRIVTIYIY